jgi:glucan 1,3-beta-glucosidase
MGTGSQHQGMFMENGSGGFMSDLVFNGGKNGIWIGNQQFTVRNLTINDATTGVFAQWNWGWTFQGVTINNAQIAFDLQTGGLTKDTQTVGSEVITDAVINNTPIFIRSSANSAGSLKGSLVIQNARLNNVPIAVAVADGTTILEGGTKTITNWVQGNIYQGTNQAASFVQADQSAPIKDGSLLDSAGRVFGKRHPQYESFDVNDFVSIRELGAKGDGVTDDTEAIQNALNANANCGKIIYFDHGVYYITKTLTIPSGSRLIGEVWPVILAGGSNFQDQANPQIAVKVGSPNETGTVEISDIMYVLLRCTFSSSLIFQSGSGLAVVPLVLLSWSGTSSSRTQALLACGTPTSVSVALLARTSTLPTARPAPRTLSARLLSWLSISLRKAPATLRAPGSGWRTTTSKTFRRAGFLPSPVAVSFLSLKARRG